MCLNCIQWMNNMSKQGKEFESLTAEIFEALRSSPQYESVQKNVKIRGADGEREIDVLLTGRVGPIPSITAIECKDYNKNVDVTTVDAFQSKLIDINANKGVLVARKGFSKTARQKAKRVGITLCTAHKVNSEKWEFDLEVPFVIHELSIESVEPEYRLLPGNFSSEEIDFWHIDGKHLHQIIGEYWNTHPELTEGAHTFKLLEQEGASLNAKSGTKIVLDHLQVKIQIQKTYYLGHFNDLESSRLLKYIEEGHCSVIFDLEELASYQSKVVKYDTLESIPNAPGATVFESRLVINPETKIPMRVSAREFLRSAR